MSHGEAARNPGDDGVTPSRPDERPRPQYGEYAPDGWTWQPPSDDPYAAPAVPREPERSGAGTGSDGRSTTPAPAGGGSLAAGSAARPADRILTIVLLALAVIGALNSVLSLQQLAPQVQLVYDQQGIGDYTAPEWLPTLVLVGTILQLALLGATIAWSVSRVRAGKLAFWVPLAGGAASVVIMMVLMSIVFLNDPTFLSYLDELSAVG